MDPKDLNLTPEEQNAEAEALKERKEDEIRAEVIAEFGFDEDNDADKIEKAVKREVAHREKLSGAIGQKIKYREALKANPPKPKEDDKGTKPTVIAPEDLDKKVNEGVTKTLEQRDLDAMDYPDNIKEEIKRVAQIQNIPVKKAERDPYIVSRIDTWKKEQKAEEATIKRNNKQGGNGGSNRKDWTVDTPPTVDFSTEEGRKEYEDWKKWAIGQESK